MQILKININNKIPTAAENYIIVCGNSDYVINFAFDEEWNSHPLKTAQFNYLSDGKLNSVPVIFEGSECAVPVLKNTSYVEIGVFAGNLQTTSILTIPCRRSILCKTGTPPAPENDVYSVILKKVDETLTTARNVEERANNGEFNGKDGAPGPQGPNGKDGAPGAPGANYILTETDKQDIADLIAKTEIGDINNALDELHNYAQAIIGGAE